MSEKKWVALFVEGCLEQLVELVSVDAAGGFCAGFVTGAQCFGGDNAKAFLVTPELLTSDELTKKEIEELKKGLEEVGIKL